MWVRKELRLKYRLCRYVCTYRYNRSKINGQMKKKGLALPSSIFSFALPALLVLTSLFGSDICSVLFPFSALLRPPLSQNCLGAIPRFPAPLGRLPHPEVWKRAGCTFCRWMGKSHRPILAFGLTKSSVAVDWSLCAGLRGSVAAGLCCRSVAVGRSL